MAPGTPHWTRPPSGARGRPSPGLPVSGNLHSWNLGGQPGVLGEAGCTSAPLPRHPPPSLFRPQTSSGSCARLPQPPALHAWGPQGLGVERKPCSWGSPVVGREEEGPPGPLLGDLAKQKMSVASGWVQAPPSSILHPRPQGELALTPASNLFPSLPSPPPPTQAA